MANVFVSLMQKLGHDMTAFGDSTGELSLDFPDAPASIRNGGSEQR
jgi:hypothetical protein